MKGVFVTGTDTDVGKTRISVALVELLQQQGLIVAGMKPIASGCEMTNDGLRNEDAVNLIQQAQCDLPYELINPYAFEPAIAPHIAAEQAGIDIVLNQIKTNFKQIQQQVDVVVVEGAGGWLVPINTTKTMADVAKIVGLPIILVVDIRLGCINHALLTVQAIKQSGLILQGWIANQRQNNQQSEAVIATLQQRITEPCLGCVPELLPQQSASEFITI